jgi:hypothetical protein
VCAIVSASSARTSASGRPAVAAMADEAAALVVARTLPDHG